MNIFFRLVVVFGFVALSDVSVTGVAFADVRQEQGIAVLQCIEGLRLRIDEATKPVVDHYFAIDQVLAGNPSYRLRSPRSLRRYIREVQNLHLDLFDATGNALDREILRCSLLLQSFDPSIRLPSSSNISTSGDWNKDNLNDLNEKNSKITPPLSVVCTDPGIASEKRKVMCR
jgi:hypothetical protein